MDVLVLIITMDQEHDGEETEENPTAAPQHDQFRPLEHDDGNNYSGHRVGYRQGRTSGRGREIDHFGDLGELCRLLLGRNYELVVKITTVFSMICCIIIYYILMSSFLFDLVNLVHDYVQSSRNELTHPLDSKENPSSKIWNLRTVPLYLIVIIMPLVNIKTPVFFTKFNALDRALVHCDRNTSAVRPDVSGVVSEQLLNSFRYRCRRQWAYFTFLFAMVNMVSSAKSLIATSGSMGMSATYTVCPDCSCYCSGKLFVLRLRVCLELIFKRFRNGLCLGLTPVFQPSSSVDDRDWEMVGVEFIQDFEFFQQRVEIRQDDIKNIGETPVIEWVVRRLIGRQAAAHQHGCAPSPACYSIVAIHLVAGEPHLLLFRWVGLTDQGYVNSICLQKLSELQALQVQGFIHFTDFYSILFGHLLDNSTIRWLVQSLNFLIRPSPELPLESRDWLKGFICFSVGWALFLALVFHGFIVRSFHVYFSILDGGHFPLFTCPLRGSTLPFLSRHNQGVGTPFASILALDRMAGTLASAYIILFVLVKGILWGVNVDLRDKGSVHYTPLFRPVTFPILTGMLTMSFCIHATVITVVRSNKYPKRNNILDLFSSTDVMAAIARALLLFQLSTNYVLVTYGLRRIILLEFFKKVYPGIWAVFILNSSLVFVCVLLLNTLETPGSVSTCNKCQERTVCFVSEKEVRAQTPVDTPPFEQVKEEEAHAAAGKRKKETRALSERQQAEKIHLVLMLKYFGAISGLFITFVIPCLIHSASLKRRAILTYKHKVLYTAITLFAVANFVAQMFMEV
uniref:(California timema) hypothetical protein n=1 Tax=Timema californicum TaxID=61474 RepID=A0A7R9JCQ5_TIMCA|nr:unnamed protein product [Timema californicum]